MKPFGHRHDAEVDLLIANWNTLPWLRLNISRIGSFKPFSPMNLHVWDDRSSDGSVEWLRESGVSFLSGAEKVGHATALSSLVKASHSEFIAFLDVDAVPIERDWLDRALTLLKSGRYAMVGLDGGSILGRKFIHVSFCVFRRKIFEELRLDPGLAHRNGILYDVGQYMCMQVQDAGYDLGMVGKAQCHPWDVPFVNQVFHFWGSTNSLNYDVTDAGAAARESASVQRQRNYLTALGLWEEFRRYASEGVEKNPRCVAYL